MVIFMEQFDHVVDTT